MTELHFETTIDRSLQAVFDLIADLSHYDKWLSPSNLYGTVTQYSGFPVERGTQYVDHGRLTRMEGRVTEFDPPHHIHFRQTTVSMLGALDIEIRYTLTPTGHDTHVRRDVYVRPTGMYGLAQGLLLGSISTESERILAMMKQYLENPHNARKAEQ
ncbi:MAG: SRPBCC family protein [Anaerolineae bacterium]|nr:SRPBCC family protein [Anaerolineae bacterium]